GPIIYPMTAAETTAAVVPQNYAYPELDVRRYGPAGAVGNNLTNDYTAWADAIAVAATGVAQNGEITCGQSRYILSGTLVVPNGVTINGGNGYQSYVSGGGGAQLFSTQNVPIITFPTAAGQNCLRNMCIVGSITATTAQHGVVIGTASITTRVQLENVFIANCGGYGLLGTNINGLSNFTNVTTQGCNAGGFTLTKTGASVWLNCYAQSNLGNGWDLSSGGGGVLGGSDKFYGCGAGENGQGLVFESGAIGHAFWDFHSESNLQYAIWFKAGSSLNSVELETMGSSGEGVLNAGATTNRIFGKNSALTTIYDPKPIQRPPAIAIVAGTTASGLTAYTPSTTAPTAIGLLAATVDIVPFAVFNRFIAKANGIAQVGTTGTMTVFIMQAGVCISARTYAVIGAVPTTFHIECEGAFTGIGTNVFTLRVASSSATDSVTMGIATNEFGGADVGSFAVEEWLPSS
ncbi:MAG TPA: hypothetical protein VMS08_03455, partial [Candidatus Saccharimonadia bacterium]|nr:hypothetical protein [Candidatus Saccharimonadia bacterium]